MAEQADWPDNPFWDFSVEVYRQAGVADACLALQERHGIDVNVLLHLLWLGARRGRRLDDDAIAEIVARAAEWHALVVRPLRALRTAMKADTRGAPRELAERLRTRIKAAELEAERIEQQMLFQSSEKGQGVGTPSAETARNNIRRYLEQLGIHANSSDATAIETIVNAAQA